MAGQIGVCLAVHFKPTPPTAPLQPFSMKKKIVLAYSGGLDTSVLLSWIKDTYDAEVIAFCANIGQDDELKGLNAKAKKTGASKIYIDDLQEEFARDFIYPMMQPEPFMRPVLPGHQHCPPSHRQAHGGDRPGRRRDRDRPRRDRQGERPSPFRVDRCRSGPRDRNHRPLAGRAFPHRLPRPREMIAYCADKNIPVQASAKKPYSSDRNLLHISFEAGILEDPWFDAFAPSNKDMFTLSVAPEDAPDKAEYVTLEFMKGDCVAVNGKELSPLQVMKTLNKLGGKHGVGRVDMVENRFVGMKSRGVYETPGGAILHFAHRQIESLTMDREVMHLRDSLIPKYATLVYNGFWYAPERLALQALVTESQKNVSGTVRVKLYKGGIYAAGRKSAYSLYNPHIATMEADPTKAYNQDDATGFIRLNGLRLKVGATVEAEVNAQAPKKAATATKAPKAKKAAKKK